MIPSIQRRGASRTAERSPINSRGVRSTPGFVIVITHIGEYLAELLLSKYCLVRTLLTAAMDEGDSTGLHQGRAKPLALVEHGLICPAQQLLIFLALAVLDGYSPLERISSVLVSGS